MTHIAKTAHASFLLEGLASGWSFDHARICEIEGSARPGFAESRDAPLIWKFGVRSGAVDYEYRTFQITTGHRVHDS